MTILVRADLVARAEVDPWKLQAQVQAGDPAAIEALAHAFYKAGDQSGLANRSASRARRWTRHGYTVGHHAPIDDNAEVASTERHLTDAQDKLPKIAKLLDGVGQDLHDTTRTANTNVTHLDSRLRSIESSWDSFMGSVGHGLPPADRDAVRDTYIQQAVTAVQSYGGTVRTAVMGYEHSLAAATRSMSDLGYVAPEALDEAGEVTTAPLPVGTSPAKVASWWASLSPAQQEYLLDHDYKILGQLRGLPSTVLDTSNRTWLTTDVTTIKRQMARLDPSSAAYAALQKRLQQDQGIQFELNQAGPGKPPVHTYLLTFDPNAPDGQTGVVISYGNPDTATNTGVVVPGTGNNATKLASVGTNGRSLYDAMDGQSKAVVVWLDGPEPQSVLPDAGFDGYANTSAPRLVTDIAGLRASHLSASGSDGHLTAVGHSYGSYILGKAMTQGANVDDVVFVGSPGVGVNHASDLGVDPSHVWDGEAGDDPILWTGKRFTPNPMDGVNPEQSEFGGQHFDVSGSHGHSEYYKPNSNSVNNIGAIASGDYSSVHTVEAPDYHGGKELPGDLIATVTNPFYQTVHAGNDLVHGHPVTTVKDLWNGSTTQAKNLWHDTEDVATVGKNAVVNTGKGVAHSIESWGESATSWIP